ncbi:prepilin peptidase [Cognatishimia sp. SS12]|uniref:prepilin peptidase n=1 Tax=Cognatishimia sp. SS12 TaxID=2979465 RepID=UPI00232D551E|nr:prepilin peptidase [Cognatishimia sp. SS12]MDC0738225.1 prepilin peptidase [Cognatishimia sp. SS12]
MSLSASAALWFLPFVAPICLYVAWSDMRAMKIPNHSVVALFAVFAVIGLIALPFDSYLWRYLHLAVVLVIGIALNAARLIGAGDAKFAAAAAPFVPAADLSRLAFIFAATLLAAWVTHRAAKHSALRRLVPDWESWQRKKDFPMGLALGGTLLIYLALGVMQGQ